MVHNNSAEATLLCDAGLVVLAQTRSFHSVVLLSPSEVQWHHMDLGFGNTEVRRWHVVGLDCSLLGTFKQVRTYHVAAGDSQETMACADEFHLMA